MTARARARALRAALAQVEADVATTMDRLAARAARRGLAERAEELRWHAARARQCAARFGSDGHGAGSDPQRAVPVDSPRATADGSPDAP